MAIFTVEKKINGQWTRWRDAKDREDAQKGVESARRCCPSDEWQVGEYVRAEHVRFVRQYKHVPGDEWEGCYGREFDTIEAARASVESAATAFPGLHQRIIRESSSVEVVETFPPRTP